jgi:hypothetical protein
VRVCLYRADDDEDAPVSNDVTFVPWNIAAVVVPSHARYCRSLLKHNSPPLILPPCFFLPKVFKLLPKISNNAVTSRHDNYLQWGDLTEYGASAFGKSIVLDICIKTRIEEMHVGSKYRKLSGRLSLHFHKISVSCCILGWSLRNGSQNTSEDYKGSRDIFDERKPECTTMYILWTRGRWMPHIDRMKIYEWLNNNDETCNRIHLNLLWKNLSHNSRSHELRTGS